MTRVGPFYREFPAAFTTASWPDVRLCFLWINQRGELAAVEWLS